MGRPEDTRQGQHVDGASAASRECPRAGADRRPCREDVIDEKNAPPLHIMPTPWWDDERAADGPGALDRSRMRERWRAFAPHQQVQGRLSHWQAG